MRDFKLNVFYQYFSCIGKFPEQPTQYTRFYQYYICLISSSHGPCERVKFSERHTHVFINIIYASSRAVMDLVGDESRAVFATIHMSSSCISRHLCLISRRTRRIPSSFHPFGQRLQNRPRTCGTTNGILKFPATSDHLTGPRGPLSGT